MLERKFLMQMGTCPFPSLSPHGVHPSGYKVVKNGNAKYFWGGRCSRRLYYTALYALIPTFTAKPF